MLATEPTTSIPSLIRDLGLGMAALFLVVKTVTPLVATLFSDQRTRLAAADTAMLERLKRAEGEVARLTTALFESVRKEAAAKAEAAAAVSDRQLLIRERDSALADIEKARHAMLDAQSKAARMRAELDSRD